MISVAMIVTLIPALTIISIIASIRVSCSYNVGVFIRRCPESYLWLSSSSPLRGRGFLTWSSPSAQLLVISMSFEMVFGFFCPSSSI
jgi:hypothetical protein